MKPVIFTLFALVLLIPGTGFLDFSADPTVITRVETNIPGVKWVPGDLKPKAIDAKKFIQKNNLSNEFCFFLDMSIASGKNRFFIYDLRKDSVVQTALVAHGNCFEFWLEGRRYSNVVGSGCTSLGKYRIGQSYYGKFGYSYKLHGLDSSNSNAFERTVVLHAYQDVPETEVTDEICQSNGCPMVAPGFFNRLKTIINRSAKPVLLWIYN